MRVEFRLGAQFLHTFFCKRNNDFNEFKDFSEADE